MKWRRLKTFSPFIRSFTHAACPTYCEGRVYFSPRDWRNRSHIYSAALDGLRLTDFREEVVPGNPGEFDDAGCMVSYVTPRDIYYVGWNLSVSVPFRNSIGLSRNGEKLIGPILDRNRYDAVGVGACWNGLEYYTSLLGWENGRPRYHIVHGKPHMPAITFKNLETEWAIARPCVIGDEMWYCYRGEEYRIGYATRKDGVWTRRDEEAGIEPSGEGFDKQAVCYPCVFDKDGARYMLFNGDGYGRTGFGLAIFEG